MSSTRCVVNDVGVRLLGDDGEGLTVAKSEATPDRPAASHGYALRYRAAIDLSSINDAHTMGILLCPPGSRVLDVGCATGDVAAALQERGCHVVGIELDPVAAERARPRCEHVVVGDVETMDLAEALERRRFDVILCLDVLEHLRDPVATLRRLVPFLDDGGRVVASIPNVAHGALRLSLLAGRFAYVDCGLLDRTHLHFYDAESVDRLFADAGLYVVERLRVTRGLTETEVDIDPAAFPDEVVARVLADPESSTYQFIRVAVPMSALARPARVAPTTPSLAEALQARVTELEAALAATEERAREDRLRAEELAEILRQRMAELEEAHTAYRHLELDLVTRDGFIAKLREELEAAEQARAAEVDELRRRLAHYQRLRYRVIDRLAAALRRVPFLHRIIKGLVRGVLVVARWIRRRPRSSA